MPSGISHLRLARFDLYRVNPPLVRMVAALPILCSAARTDWAGYPTDTLYRSEFNVGIQFLELNGFRSFWYFTLARWACIPFSLLGGYVCFRWARERYGPFAGLLALTLWCFSPNILAHAQLITPDAGATALGVVAGYCFWRWLKRPGWPIASLVGLALGLAELAKATWIVLFVLWPLLWLVWRWPERRKLAWRDWRGQGVQMIFLLFFSLYVFNLGYGFEGSFRKLGDYQFVSQTLAGPAGQGGNRFANTWLGRVPVALPRNYVQGVDRTKFEFEQKKWSYLRGEWRFGGWWYYYLYALMIKVPLGTWVLVVLAVLVPLLLPGYWSPWRDELLLLAPLLVVLTFVSSQTGYTHHLRYVLPIFPFAFIWASKVARAIDLKKGKIPAVAGAALIWLVGSSLWIYPHSLSYFNELVRGPRGGHAHLDYSNIDFGQDLLYLKRWLEKHPEAEPLRFAYSCQNFVDPTVAGIQYSLPPVRLDYDREPSAGTEDEPGPLPGWYAISVQRLIDGDKAYSYLDDREPVAMVGYSIYVYHITLDEANRMRGQLGMPPLPRDDAVRSASSGPRCVE